VGVNCRDRNRVALEGEIAACVDAGAVAAHCVTGDHPALGHRPDAEPVFDLDSVALVELATGRGLLCSVAHAPAAPPTGARLPRLLTKVDAGADAVFVDHCGGPGPVAAAVAALRATGFGGLVLACVPVVTDRSTAEVVASFAGEALPAGHIERILAAGDPTAAGITATVELARAMLAAADLDGVNLSGGTRPGDERAAARAVAEISRRLRDAPPRSPERAGPPGDSAAARAQG
jgi:methylenetetrahydrofolate reductase (NADPH)